mgnify:CR=1 FL=1
MNQILSVENTKNKKKKSSVHSVIIVFCIILIIFGIGLTSTGAYSYYRNLTNNIDDNIISTNSTKAVITTERVNASTINIAVEHDKGITSVVYQINDENPVELDAKNKMEFKQEVELPSGNCSIKITAKDINGITSSYESSYEVEDKPIITLEQENGKIKATIESKKNLDYIIYYWDDDETNAKKGTFNKQKVETYIEVLEGTHTLNVIAVDIDGAQTKKAQKIIGDNKPNVEVKTNGKVFRIIASDDESISKIEYKFNSDEVQTEEINQMEYTKDIELQNGENNLTVTIYNKNGLSVTSTVKYVKE